MKISATSDGRVIRLTCEQQIDEIAEATPRGAGLVVETATDEFRTALAESIDTVRAQLARGPQSSLSSSPSCTGCGTAVEKKGDLCPACEHKNYLRAPEATIALVNQGEPLYKREGNFRDAPTEREEMV
jgi:rRNA maturation endonuclease Nob1